MKLLKYLLTLLTLSLAADTINVVIDGVGCTADKVIFKGNPVNNIKVRYPCVVNTSTANEAPIAIVVSASYEENATAYLYSTGSNDPDGTIASYRWKQKNDGCGVVSLTNADQATASFTAGISGQTCKFSLLVTDNDGGQDMAIATITTTVPAANQDPVSVAAADYSIDENLIASLDGSGSYDPNGAITEYLWTQTAGTAVTIVLDSQAIASFTPPDVSTSTALTFNLLVTDADSATHNDTIIVTIDPVTSGTVYYVSDCGAGADGDCVSGSDANDGLSKANALETYDAAQDLFASLSSGGEIRLARGGSFTVAGSNQWVNDNTAGADPLIVSDYTPTWGSGDENRPIVTQVGNSPVFSLTNSGDAATDGNYTFSNLDIQCVSQTSPSAGFIFGNDVNDLTIDNVNIDSCYLGIHSQTSGVCAQGDTTCNARNDRVTIRNSSIINNKRAGFFGHGDDIVIENNTFTNNGAGEGSQGHNLYSSGFLTGRISGNNLYQSALDGSGDCAGASMVFHGVNSDVLIDNNIIHEDVSDALSACWGIQLSGGYGSEESFTDITIRGNEIDDMGNTFISVASCINCLIETNILTQTQATGTTAISARNRPSSGDLTSTNVDVKNNIISFTNNSNKTGVSVNTEGTGHEISGNTVTESGSGSFTCVTPSSTTADVTVSGNICP